MKKHITPIYFIFFLWTLLFIFISKEYSEYSRYFYYLSLTVIISVTIFNLIKQRKEDLINGTTLFKSAIHRMLIMAVILGVFFFLTMKPNII